MLKFAIATLGPAGLLTGAALYGGAWSVLAVVAVTAMVTAMDRLTRGIALPLARCSAARALSVTLGALHFPLLALGVLALSGATGLAVWERLAAFLAFGVFFGQVSNSNAHELIHASPRAARRLGEWVYISLLFGHHASAHRLVHHVHAATNDDPNSARPGEGLWRFLPRAWIGSFRAGFRAESKRCKPGTLHPYARYVGGAGLTATTAFALAGWAGVLSLVCLAGYATMQLLMSDYVQHYGLRRRVDTTGRLEPVGPQHSWNAPHWYSAALMLNAPRHSDHHIRPGRGFEELEIDAATMPILPHSLPVMATIATIPPLWRRVMDRRAARWQGAGGSTPA
ncbi:alkane 1-monooxygenase [Mesobacterium pallidum]|uniref:alkane 1-monooxygenase n=1 Tax=Mesobacterium pallidum TaxID=2872037 RepID=UPI001EE2681D|nr:alkane 1-monooxygenase [Mesobacterium pallidum]